MNGGALALREGVLFWGLDLGRGSVRPYDLDGRPLAARLDLGPKSSISGLAADSDRRLWVADTTRGELRGVNLFGFEGADFVPIAGPLEAPAGGLTDGPVDVALAPSRELVGLWVALGGRRRGAVGLFLPDGTRIETLRSLGDPKLSFDRVTHLAGAGELLAVLESGAERIQVFRRGEFHFSFGPASGRPVAVALLADGCSVVAERVRAGAERLVLVDAAGRELTQLVPRAEAGGGEVEAVVDLAIEDTGCAHGSRLFVLDQEGLRVQVFNLEGRCYGGFGAMDEPDFFTEL